MPRKMDENDLFFKEVAQQLLPYLVHHQQSSDVLLVNEK